MVQDKSKLTFDQFENLADKGKVIVRFFATWCGPCNSNKPFYDEVSNERTDITFYEIDVDKNKEITDKFEVKGYPTFFLIDNGEVFHKQEGFLDKKGLESFIEAFNK